MKIVWVVYIGYGLLLAGCANTGSTGAFIDEEEVYGVIYSLPKHVLRVEGNANYRTQKNIIKQNEKYIVGPAKTKATTVSVVLDLKLERDPVYSYAVDAKTGWANAGDFTVVINDNGIIESVNDSSTGKAGEVISNVASFVGKVGAFAAGLSSSSDVSVESIYESENEKVIAALRSESPAMQLYLLESSVAKSTWKARFLKTMQIERYNEKIMELRDTYITLTGDALEKARLNIDRLIGMKTMLVEEKTPLGAALSAGLVLFKTAKGLDSVTTTQKISEKLELDALPSADLFFEGMNSDQVDLALQNNYCSWKVENDNPVDDQLIDEQEDLTLSNGGRDDFVASNNLDDVEREELQLGNLELGNGGASEAGRVSEIKTIIPIDELEDLTLSNGGRDDFVASNNADDVEREELQLDNLELGNEQSSEAGQVSDIKTPTMGACENASAKIPVMKLWRNYRILVTADGIEPNENIGEVRKVSTENDEIEANNTSKIDNDYVLHFRQPSKLHIKAFHLSNSAVPGIEVQDGLTKRMVLKAEQVETVMHPSAPPFNIGFKSGSFSTQTLAIMTNAMGGIKTMKRTSTSGAVAASGSASMALTNVASSYDAISTTIDAIKTRDRAGELADLTHEAAQLAERKKILDAQIALAGGQLTQQMQIDQAILDAELLALKKSNAIETASDAHDLAKLKNQLSQIQENYNIAVAEGTGDSNLQTVILQAQLTLLKQELTNAQLSTDTMQVQAVAEINNKAAILSANMALIKTTLELEKIKKELEDFKKELAKED